MRRKLKNFAKNMFPKKYHQKIRLFYNYFNSLFYLGRKYSCPWCERKSRKFLDYNENVLNVLCPKCNSHARHRLLWFYLKNKTNLFSEKLRLLHFAPEYVVKRYLQNLPELEYISADLDSPLAKVEIDIEDIQYKDDYVDAILCLHVLEHVSNDRKAMQELFRILKPGGWAILQVPIDLNRSQTLEDPDIVTPEARKQFYGEADHVRCYGLDYKDRLESAGFTVIVDSYVRELGEEFVKKNGLDNEEDIYLCLKPNR